MVRPAITVWNTIYLLRVKDCKILQGISAAVFIHSDKRWNPATLISFNTPSQNLTDEVYALISYLFKIRKPPAQLWDFLSFLLNGS